MILKCFLQSAIKDYFSSQASHFHAISIPPSEQAPSHSLVGKDGGKKKTEMLEICHRLVVKGNMKCCVHKLGQRICMMFFLTNKRNTPCTIQKFLYIHIHFSSGNNLLSLIIK